MRVSGLLRWCEARPRLVLVVLTAVCLAAFLVTIPLPRVDGQLLGTDGFGYFAYLPSIVIDGDVDLSNQYTALGQGNAAQFTRRTPIGRVNDPWPVGAALLWLPFFLLAHALAIVLNLAGVGIRLDGCGYWYQAFVISGNIAYGGAALLLTYSIARRLATASSALWGTVLVGFAGNLVYYLTAEASMAHAVAAFAVSLFYAVWLAEREGAGAARSVRLGGLVGLIALVRPQDLILVAIPLALELTGRVRAPRDGRSTASRATVFHHVLVMALAAVVVCSPQLVVSQALYGAWWRTPQLSVRRAGLTLFNWSSPHLADVLVSATRGVFVWHPIYALALVGAVPLWRRHRAMAVALVAGVAGEAYLLGAWFGWAQGHAFGGRAFISCLPLCAVGLASLLDAGRTALSARPRLWRWLLAGASAALVAANFLLFVEYRFDMAVSGRTATWYDLGAGRVTFLVSALSTRAHK